MVVLVGGGANISLACLHRRLFLHLVGARTAGLMLIGVHFNSQLDIIRSIIIACRRPPCCPGSNARQASPHYLSCNWLTGPDGAAFLLEIGHDGMAISGKVEWFDPSSSVPALKEGGGSRLRGLSLAIAISSSTSLIRQISRGKHRAKSHQQLKQQVVVRCKHLNGTLELRAHAQARLAPVWTGC